MALAVKFGWRWSLAAFCLSCLLALTYVRWHSAASLDSSVSLELDVAVRWVQPRGDRDNSPQEVERDLTPTTTIKNLNTCKAT